MRWFLSRITLAQTTSKIVPAIEYDKDKTAYGCYASNVIRGASSFQVRILVGFAIILQPALCRTVASPHAPPKKKTSVGSCETMASPSRVVSS